MVPHGRVNRDRQKAHVQNETYAGGSLLTDKLTLEIIRNFLADEHKPQDLDPVDLLMVVYMMARKAEDGGITDSQQLIARRMNCSPLTIGRSQKRLKAKANYITCVRRKGRTSELTINAANIPAEEPLRILVTEEATRLAAWYKGELQKRHRKKFQKRFTEHNAYTAQRILNDCGGDVDLAKRLIEFALDPGLYRKAAMQGLYRLYGKWPRLKNSYRAGNPESPPMPEPQPGIPESAPTIENLTKTLAARFTLGPTEQAAWQATLQRLSDAGNSIDHLQAVFSFSLNAIGEENSRSGGAAMFEKHFSTLAELMQQSEQQTKEVSA